MCRFPASGSSWKSFAREGVAMDDPGCRQGVTLSERSELVPKEPTPAIPPRQLFLPNPRDLIGVPAYSSKVARYTSHSHKIKRSLLHVISAQEKGFSING